MQSASHVHYTCKLVVMEDTWEICRMCVKMTSFVSIMYEWNSQEGSAVVKLMPPNRKSLGVVQHASAVQFQVSVCRWTRVQTDRKCQRYPQKWPCTASLTWQVCRYHCIFLKFGRGNCPWQCRFLRREKDFPQRSCPQEKIKCWYTKIIIIIIFFKWKCLF